MLTPQQTVSLYRAVAAVRPDWDDAGVHAFVAQLASDPRPAHVLALQVFTAASRADRHTPECILTPPGEHLPVSRAPRRDDPQCLVHGSTVMDDQGRFVCCREEPVAGWGRPARPVSTPPDEVRAAVEARFGHLRRHVS